MPRAQSVVAPGLDSDWELRSTEIPAVGPGQVLVKVHACGICGTDVWITEGKLSFGVDFPMTLGHEGVGEVVAVGDGVTSRTVGDRVGIVTLQNGCGQCAWCRRAEPLDFVTAANCERPVLIGMNVSGAQSEYVAARADATVLLPEGLSYEHAAPLMCVGYTAWSGLRRARPEPGDVVAVSGIGGLGHLAVQYAKAAGFTTIAITQTPDKRELAHELGADLVVSNGAELRAAGGANVLLHTNSSNAAVSDALQGVNARGRVVLMGVAFDTFAVGNMPVVMNSIQILGSAHNGTEYLVEALQLAADGKVTPMVEVYDKEQAADAYRRTAEGKARFRTVIKYA
ncbi:alcohol dehydrogenase catalytic domain-containing protein [Streptomyces sp. NL15-2K]|uniref:alcohol dehydrogenase catalytic domain-containing protein n=1 Tax=Streptomyces sp. NL15-2K TaxID=376149 RepID=UPI000F589DA3|nr:MULTISPECIES: alcohol dehydrogenase catalytic domain-containing protein [Actinomycetes]WKX14277.1 alcohol dehydrogenase catalytic domain-containing protein [Kutzneria buriramensis]GCB53387.1 alcohol dehydrogenase [Streptomyces sp. NL15-2K]